MLNPTFPKSALTFDDKSYVAPGDIARSTLEGNQAIDEGEEFRLQSVYGDEIWLKLERAGIRPEDLNSLSVLEVCGGGGFLAYHLLQRASPATLVINDISANELEKSKQLISASYPDTSVDYVLGDMHLTEFNQKFDLIIGNSFLHHFHDVPKVLSRFHELLNEGGRFISMHEPTPMSTIVESAKLIVYPLAVVAPRLVNNLMRARYRGQPSATDIWMFEPAQLQKIAKSAGFSAARIYPWHWWRAVTMQRRALHLNAQKPELSTQEEKALRRAIGIDSFLNKVLPSRFFGSICLVCRK